MLPIDNILSQPLVNDMPRVKTKAEPPDLAGQLRQAIAGCGLSLNQLGEASGGHKAQLSRFVRAERSLTLPAAVRLCAYLGLHLTGPAFDKKK